MATPERQEKLRQVITESVNEVSNVDPILIREDSTLGDDYELDSLDRIEVGMMIEKELGMHVPDELIEQWHNKTINDIYEQLKDMV